MQSNIHAWIVIVDNGQGRLLRGSTAPPGRYHLELDDTITNTEEEHQHGRPSPRAGKAGNSYASRSRENEERMKRFARRVVEWLQHKTAALDIKHLSLFAPPRFLGVLRQAYPAQLAERLTEYEGDLGYMAPGDLVRHRAIAGILGALAE